MNLTLVQTGEEMKLIKLLPSGIRFTSPYQSNLESKAELKRTKEELHIQWPVIKASKRAVHRMLRLYQHGQQPKMGSTFKPMVTNPWDKEFSHKDFPSSHKVPSNLPKRWEQHDVSPVMLKPPISTAVEQVRAPRSPNARPD